MNTSTATVNRLINVSNDIGQLINLQEFNCSGNKLTNLPNEMGQLINLTATYNDNASLVNLSNNIRQLATYNNALEMIKMYRLLLICVRKVVSESVYELFCV